MVLVVVLAETTPAIGDPVTGILLSPAATTRTVAIIRLVLASLSAPAYSFNNAPSRSRYTTGPALGLQSTSDLGWDSHEV